MGLLKMRMERAALELGTASELGVHPNWHPLKGCGVKLMDSMALLSPFQFQIFYDKTASFIPSSPLTLASSLPR